MYDFVNQEIVETFHIYSLPKGSRITYISIIDKTNFLICLNCHQVFVLSFETSKETSNTSLSNIDISNIVCWGLSPDNSYLACCYDNRILTIRRVDNGETLQIVVLRRQPRACFWTKLYFWVACEDVLIKRPYDLTQINILGNDIEERTLRFDIILTFAYGVLVIQAGYGKNSILKICDEIRCLQQTLDSIFRSICAVVSSDAGAVLLFGKDNSVYQLWEMSCDNKWQLRLVGSLHDIHWASSWSCLTGFSKFDTQDCRTLNLIHRCDTELLLCSIDFPNGTQRAVQKLHLPHPNIRNVIHLDPKVVIVDTGNWIYFVKVLDGKIFASLFIGEFRPFLNASFHYLAKQNLLFLAGKKDIRFLKINNIENYIYTD